MKKMQRVGAVLIVFTMAVTLLSCSKSVAGTYLSTNDSQTTLELKGDGSFSMHRKGSPNPLFTGSYKVQDKVITFTLSGENTTGNGKIEGDTVTDPDGNTWKKQ